MARERPAMHAAPEMGMRIVRGGILASAPVVKLNMADADHHDVIV